MRGFPLKKQISGKNPTKTSTERIYGFWNFRFGRKKSHKVTTKWTKVVLYESFAHLKLAWEANCIARMEQLYLLGVPLCKNPVFFQLTCCIFLISPGSSLGSFSGFCGSALVSASDSSVSELEELSDSLEIYSPGSLSDIPSVPGGGSKIERDYLFISRSLF